MKDTHTLHTLRTFFDDCELTLRYDGATAHFDLWIPGEADPEPIAAIPVIGGKLEWTPSGRELLDVSYAEDLQHLINSFAALVGDRRRYKLSRKWYVWEVSDAGGDEDDENKPLVIARSDERLGIVTHRNDRKAGYVGWRIHWDGDPHSEPSDGDAPAVYFLVETSSQQYSEEYGEPTYGTQVWRIEGEEVTHDAWFACGPSDPATAVKKLCDVYVVAGAVPIYRVFLCYEHELTRAAIPPVDPDSLRVVESANNACCYLVY